MLDECSSLFSIQGSGSHGAPPFLVCCARLRRLSLTVEEDFKGLSPFYIKSPFSNLT